ncbi:hypothetical protein ISN45_Aa05g029210, partial [Arabidopsis thaliana x Arabidopsis arenosa]
MTWVRAEDIVSLKEVKFLFSTWFWFSEDAVRLKQVKSITYLSWNCMFLLNHWTG